jgi:hypothetical protein
MHTRDHDGKLTSVEGTSGPGSEADETIAVRLDERELTVQIRVAALCFATTCLGKEGLTAIRLQPVVEGLEHRSVVSNAVGVRARVVRVQVLVHVEDQLAHATSWIRDLEQGRARLGRERLCRRPGRSRDEDVL